jgi:hypothetical protein
MALPAFPDAPVRSVMMLIESESQVIGEVLYVSAFHRTWTGGLMPRLASTTS